MSRRRKLGIALGIVLAVIVAASAIGVGWLYVTLRPLGEFFEHGLLGPPDRRQRVELPDHGLVISFADDWVVETDPDSVVSGQWDVDPILVAGPERGVPRCHVGVVLDGGSLDVESFLLVRAADHAEDEHGTWSASDLPEGVVGLGLRDTDGTLTAAYWVPHEDDALIVSCDVDAGHDRPPGDDGVFTPDAQAMLRWGMPPIIKSIAALPAASPGPTDASLGPGHRVETPGGLAVTLPEGWTSLGPEPGEDEEWLPILLGRLWPWRVSASVTVIGPRPDDGEGPVETCTLGAVVLADYMRSWDEASLESIVALVDGIVAPGDIRGAEFEPASATYFDPPAGPVARLDFSDDGSYRSVYVLPQYKTLHLLVCEGPERGVDVWDSLAHSIEVTPENAS